MKRIVLLLALAPLLVGSDLDPPGTEVVVALNRLRFEPAVVEVRLGARVTFHNMDAGDGTCTIVASDGSFESRPLAAHGEWSYRFRARGEHEYFIVEHPETKGRAVVR
jgi:plastocyanin